MEEENLENNNLSQLGPLEQISQATTGSNTLNHLMLEDYGNILLDTSTNTLTVTSTPNYPNELSLQYMEVDLSIHEIKEELNQLGNRMMELRDMLERKMDVPTEKIERRKLKKN